MHGNFSLPATHCSQWTLTLTSKVPYDFSCCRAIANDLDELKTDPEAAYEKEEGEADDRSEEWRPESLDQAKQHSHVAPASHRWALLIDLPLLRIWDRISAKGASPSC